MAKNKMHALGIMNGTSIDAVDYALIESDPQLKTYKFLKHKQFSIPKNLKERLLSAASDHLSTYETSELHFDLGRLYGQHIKKLKKDWNWDVIGMHGQTVHHHGRKASLQIGHPAFIAKESDKPVIYDFRSNDVALDGQGAPFAPFFQKVLGEQWKKETFTFHNLGGISNLTHFNKGQIKAFDTGPANILLDLWMNKEKGKPFDRNGQQARLGLPEPTVVNQMLAHPYFKLKAPKSCGREEFNLSFIKEWGGRKFTKLSFPDQMATLVELTALSLQKAYLKEFKNLPEEIYFYGGGVLNPYLIERIQYWMPETEILTTDERGWPSQAFEASAFAFLALARLKNKKVHLPEVTGAKNHCHLGQIYSL